MKKIGKALLVVVIAALPFMAGMANGQVATKPAGDFALIDHKGYFHHMAWYDNNRAVVFLVQTNASQAARAAVPAYRRTIRFRRHAVPVNLWSEVALSPLCVYPGATLFGG